MVWIELLKGYDLPPEIIESIGQGVNRLELTAYCFWKVGSLSELSLAELNELITTFVQYLSWRTSRQVEILSKPVAEKLYCLIVPDLTGWVVENIVGNGVDAMDDKDIITITAEAHGENACLEITDTGRGMTHVTQRMILKLGFTTKERDWGLGLSLARHTIRHYFRGRIYVKRSGLQVGATFRITLPLQRLP